MAFYDEIRKQLGGSKFVAMTGARNFSYSDKNQSLSFSLPKAVKNKIKYVNIILNPLDLYSIEFYNAKGVITNTTENVYAEDLQDVFTNYTGLDTHL